jgi:DNA-binding CsgD family transcriptional regulator
VRTAEPGDRIAALEQRVQALEEALPASARPATLTLAERRVALLASAGETNDEIAAALHLSPKTVEWTLTRVYRKLGVRSRTTLAARLR